MDMDMETVMDAQCALLGLQLSAEQRPGVLRYLQLVATMAPLVTEFAEGQLTAPDESGSVFVPVKPASAGDPA